MDIHRDISGLTITEIQHLSKGHPVFLVKTASDVFVIKGETARSNKFVSFPADIMNVVDPNAQSRVLKKTELFKIRDWVQANKANLVEKDPGSLLNSIGESLRPPAPGGVINQTGVMTIMEAKINLRDLEAAGEKALGGDKTDIRAIAKALNAPGGLEKLGAILAADAFSGNQDRVNFAGNGGKKLESGPLKCINNPGNIFVADEKGRPTVLGLDVYDPFGDFKNPADFSRDNFYPGTMLKKDAVNARRALLTKLVEDIESILGPRNRAFSFLQQTRLPVNAVDRLEAGIMAGADKVLAHLKQRYANGGVGGAMTFRLNAIGWLTRANFPKL